jgi:small neutral amino acid transporter SnatA (MarC family)
LWRDRCARRPITTTSIQATALTLPLIVGPGGIATAIALASQGNLLHHFADNATRSATAAESDNNNRLPVSIVCDK